MLQMGDTILVDDDPGPELTFRGTVRDLDGNLLDGAELDVWQGASNGMYNVQDADQSDTNLRGRFVTGSDGSYEFRTVRPVAYPVPEDGPVGAMLRANGRHNWRPAHTHVVVSAPSYKTIITHLFDRDSDFLDSDTVFGVRDSLVVDMSGSTVDYDFVLERCRLTRAEASTVPNPERSSCPRSHHRSEPITSGACSVRQRSTPPAPSGPAARSTMPNYAASRTRRSPP